MHAPHSLYLLLSLSPLAFSSPAPLPFLLTFLTSYDTHLSEMVRDISTIRKVSLTEKDLELATQDNWKYVQQRERERERAVSVSSTPQGIPFSQPYLILPFPPCYPHSSPLTSSPSPPHSLPPSLSLRVFDAPEGQGISLAKFLHVVGQLKFRGTSVLFRLPRSPVVKKLKENGGQDKPHKPKAVAFAGLEPIPDERKEGRGGGEEGREEGEEDMEVGGVNVRNGMHVESEGVDGGGVGEERVGATAGGGDASMNIDGVDPNVTLPMVKIKNENGEEEADESIFNSEAEEFTIATHFVKVNLRIGKLIQHHYILLLLLLLLLLLSSSLPL